MWQALQRICELQRSYTRKNTPEMQERWALLSTAIKPAVEALKPSLARGLGRFGDSFLVEVSDGIGNKTELPWARFCSEAMSPRPTEGFYCVIHFSTDGSACHVTIGCGSSKFRNGSSVPLPNEELDSLTEWARAMVLERGLSLAPFVDPPDFGARRKLPKSFERATAISKRVPFSEIQTTDFQELLFDAAIRLKAIYEAQSDGRHLSEADQAELEVLKVLAPERGRRLSQGYGLPAAAKKAVEHRAMDVSRQYLEACGYKVEDRSASESFDLLATRADEKIQVEVKGTTSDKADAILMTHNEVELHRDGVGTTALLIVSKIRLVKTVDEYKASGGELEALIGWNISDWELQATTFRVSRKV
jgi:hypothetical protein